MKAERILIVKLSSIGDLFQALLCAQYLKKQNNHHYIAWVVEKRLEKVIEGSPYIDKIYTVDIKGLKKKPIKLLFQLLQLRKESFDVVFDLQGNCKSGLVTAFSKGRKKVGFGRKSVAEWPNLLTTTSHVDTSQLQSVIDKNLHVIRSHFKNYEDPALESHILTGSNMPCSWIMPKNAIMVCSGSNWPNKKLSEEVLASFLNEIEKRYDVTFVLVWGAALEQREALKLAKRCTSQTFIIGSLPYASWQQVMSQMKLIITVDSSALHLAALTNTPTFSLFGPSSLKAYKPPGERHYGVQGVCPYSETFDKRCNRLRTCSTGACIKNLTPEALINELRLFIENQKIDI